jgi:hypothetical protein
MAASSLRLAVFEAKEDQDRRKRNEWLRRMKSCKVGASILVGEDVTLAEVIRWLDEAVERE